MAAQAKSPAMAWPEECCRKELLNSTEQFCFS